MLDFEAAAWSALKEVYPTVKLLGCVYHWKQAVWRKIQEVGLSRTYMDRGDVYHLLSKLMALPYLPHEHIPAVFSYLQGKAGDTRELGEVRNLKKKTSESSNILQNNCDAVFNMLIYYLYVCAMTDLK